MRRTRAKLFGGCPGGKTLEFETFLLGLIAVMGFPGPQWVGQEQVESAFQGDGGGVSWPALWGCADTRPPISHL